MLSIFLTSLYLGLTCFGGPIAHIGYFERHYVRKKKWVTEEDFLSLLAVCQTLPGPASSQLNFLIGWKRGGFLGAILSFIGFTMPSAIFLYCFAGVTKVVSGASMSDLIHGLKLVAVCIVAQAVLSMSKKLCYDKPRIWISVCGFASVFLLNNAFSQIIVIALGGILGLLFCKNNVKINSQVVYNFVSKKTAFIALILFMLFSLALPLLLLTGNKLIAIMSIFYKSGALVFGGGHVILPLLHEAFVPSGIMTDEAFLAGYGMAQAIPGPLLTIASYLGSLLGSTWQASAFLAFAAVCVIFLPGFLIATFGVFFWNFLSKNIKAHNALSGINASVVGILAAAFYNPVLTSAITNKADVIIALIGFFMLEKLKMHSIYVVMFCVITSLCLPLIYQAV